MYRMQLPLPLIFHLFSLISFALAANVTSLTGTWSTGSGAVQTGPVSHLYSLLG
jgi:hypothetical protein